MSEHLRRMTAAVIVCCAVPVLLDGAAQFGWLRGSKPQYQPFKDPGGRFSLEYPRDWQVIAGVGDVIATFSDKKGAAAFIVERVRLNQALAPEEITEVFGQLEADVVKERQPKATDVTSKVIDAHGRRVVVIEYARPGLGGPERVRQYSFPVQDEMFRLTCSAVVAQFAKYDALFAHIADSFNPAPVTARGK